MVLSSGQSGRKDWEEEVKRQRKKKQYEEAWKEGKGGSQSRGAQARGAKVQKQPDTDKIKGSHL
jgi:hypothetical protein